MVHRSTAVRGRGGPPPPWESSCRTRTGPVEADGTVDAQNAPTAPWKTLRVFHELPQGLSHRITHAKPRKAPKWRWETRIDPYSGDEIRAPGGPAGRLGVCTRLSTSERAAGTLRFSPRYPVALNQLRLKARDSHAGPAEVGDSRRGHLSTGTFRPFGPPCAGPVDSGPVGGWHCLVHQHESISRNRAGPEHRSSRTTVRRAAATLRGSCSTWGRARPVGPTPATFSPTPCAMCG